MLLLAFLPWPFDALRKSADDIKATSLEYINERVLHSLPPMQVTKYK
jgi:hypothetical protein